MLLEALKPGTLQGPNGDDAYLGRVLRYGDTTEASSQLRALASYGMLSSMSRKGNCWDNAPTESLWGSLKVGRLYGKKFATQREAMDEVIDWLTFYNHRRLHSTLGYVSPMRFEADWHAGQAKKAA